MPTLYVENVPPGLYEALKQRAREHRKSIAAEVLALLEQNVVTKSELAARRQFLRRAQRLRSQSHSIGENFPSSEAMQREDRQR
jgi:plasmid stability protein